MNAPGDPEVLTVRRHTEAGTDRSIAVLVKLHAAGVNPIDTKVRKLNMLFPWTSCLQFWVVMAPGSLKR